MEHPTKTLWDSPPKLKYTHKRTWLRALRSGEYKQAIGHLCVQDEDGFSFCSLGVAVDVLAETDWVLDAGNPFPRHADLWGVRVEGWDRLFINTPGVGLARAWFQGKNSWERVQGVIHECRVANDTEGWSFEKIADWIEEHL